MTTPTSTDWRKSAAMMMAGTCYDLAEIAANDEHRAALNRAANRCHDYTNSTTPVPFAAAIHDALQAIAAAVPQPETITAQKGDK